jgi:hypothetical protein
MAAFNLECIAQQERVCICLGSSKCGDRLIFFCSCAYRAIVTVTTVGYGDIVASNHTERIFVIVVGLVGGIVFAFSLGNITSLISATQVCCMPLSM